VTYQAGVFNNIRMQSTLFHAEQIPLEFPVRQALAREDFMIGESNRDAVLWIDQWPNWPAPALFLSGPASSGKSHLAAVWQSKAEAASVQAKDLVNYNAEALAQQGKHLVIDGIDPWLGDKDAETTLFHLYNMFKEEQRTLFLTGRATPTEIDFAIPDLASRMRAAPCATIKSPDDTLLLNVMVKMFADRQINIGEAELKYIAPRMERSFQFIGDIVAECDKIALSQHRAITVPLIRDTLLKL